MSIINEALKQASRIQQSRPLDTPGGGIPLQPVETGVSSRPGSAILTSAVTSMLLIGGWLVYQGIHPPQPVTASSPSPNLTATISPPPEQSQSASMARSVESDMSDLSENSDLSDMSDKPDPSDQTVQPVRVAARAKPAPPVRPAFPELQLSAILLSPSRPSATVNGRPLFVGETVQGARLISISQYSVVFEFDGRQKTLTMP